MNELIQAATRALNAVASYYEKQAGIEGEKHAIRSALTAAEPAPTRARKPRADKAPEAAATAVTLPSAPAVNEPVNLKSEILTEAQSEERLKVVGEAFVQRFSKSGDAVDEVKKTIESRFKVTRLRDLVHAQRVELLSLLEARIREIDSKQTQSAAPIAAPAGLGL